MDKLEIKFVKIDGIEFDVNKLRGEDLIDRSIFLTCEYKNGKLQFRKNLEIINPENIKNGLYEIKFPLDEGCKSSRIVIGKGNVKNNKLTFNSCCINNKYECGDIDSLFSSNDDEYKNGIFKIYYDTFKNKIENYYLGDDDIVHKSSNKSGAMRSYLAIRDYMDKYKDRCKISEPNVFIKKDYKEYDFLILKNNVKINQGFYKKEDVVACCEIKTGGFFEYKKDKFEDGFKNYIDNEIRNDLHYIYFSILEDEECSRKAFKILKEKNKKNENKVFGVFVTLVAKGNGEFVVPNKEKRDLDSIMRELDV